MYIPSIFIKKKKKKKKIRQIAWGIACLGKEETCKGIFI